MALIKCGECSSEVSDKAKTCPNCGAPVIALIRCTECSNEISNNAKTCPKCGAPVVKYATSNVVFQAEKKVNNTFIWLLAFTPIIGEVVKLILLNNGYNLGDNNTFSSLIFYFILNSILVTLDDKQVKNAGYETDTFVSIFWGFLLIPVYFWRRASLTKQSKSYFWVWIVSLIISVFISSAYSNSFKIDNAREKEQLQTPDYLTSEEEINFESKEQQETNSETTNDYFKEVSTAIEKRLNDLIESTNDTLHPIINPYHPYFYDISPDDYIGIFPIVQSRIREISNFKLLKTMEHSCEIEFYLNVYDRNSNAHTGWNKIKTEIFLYNQDGENFWCFKALDVLFGDMYKDWQEFAMENKLQYTIQENNNE